MGMASNGGELVSLCLRRRGSVFGGSSGCFRGFCSCILGTSSNLIGGRVRGDAVRGYSWLIHIKFGNLETM